MFVCLYMPFYDSSNRTQCLSETMEAIAMLEEIIADHPLHSFVVGGDFNTEFRDNSPFDVLWRECLLKNDLVCCDHLFNNNSNNNNMHTYVHQTLDHSKWNDHFLISSCLTRASSHHVIMEDGANVSDHLPIMMSLTCNLSQAPTLCCENVKPPTLKWEKCSNEQKANYKNRLAQQLGESPSLLPVCSNIHCKTESCQTNIQAEYDNIMRQIKVADECLPRLRPGVQKSWWTDELTSLRQRSIDIHRLWLAEGRLGRVLLTWKGLKWRQNIKKP